MNHLYIVRYYQTWVEKETDPDVLKMWKEESDDEYDSEEETDSPITITKESVKTKSRGREKEKSSRKK